MKKRYYLLTIALGLVALWMIQSSAQEPKKNPPTEARSRGGLQALYDFRSEEGVIVKDRSGVGKPLDLRIENLKAVRRAEGSLEIRQKTILRSEQPAAKLINSIRRSGELTVEAWARPANTNQSGPARIVTISKNSNERNFTLGQDGDRFEARLRTTKTSTNGIPALPSPKKSLSTKLMHIVYTRDRSGQARMYLDGKKIAEQKIAGDTSKWDGSFQLALANELSGDRPWLGTYHLVAIYNRALSGNEIEQHFKAGVESEAALAHKSPAASEGFFHARIAPLLARHCVECHGGKSKRGRLSMVRKEDLLQGGKSGRVIVPGDAEQSLLWKSVHANEMPKNRTPLAKEEKEYLRQWINAGANWFGGAIEARSSGQLGEQVWVRRLTVPEYIETVRVAVGEDIAKDARQILPRDLRADGFSNTAYNLNVDLGHVEAYAKLAEIIVARMNVEAFVARFSQEKNLAEASMRKLIASMGQWLLRGPLQEHEIQAYLQVPQAVVKEGGNYQEAVGLLLEAMLQSPRFIYRVENQQGEGKPKKLTDYELASRLSYILWGGPPDKELYRAAQAGELSDPAQAEKQVQRMLGDPRAITHSSRFIREWLNLDRLDNLVPNPKRFPNWKPELAEDMRQETLAFFNEIVWQQKRPLSDLLNAQVTFATPQLAKHYGLTPQGNDLTKYDLSKVPSRGGLLTQGSVLTLGGDEASMVTRGLFVLHELLDGHVDDPPPGVDTTPVPSKPGLSQRDVAKGRIANVACGACHTKFEPLAFGLERFDGLGTYHEKDDHGNQLRDDGEILFPGSEKPVSYQSSAELMDLLAKSDRTRETIHRKVIQWTLGRPLVKEDEPIIDKIHAEAKKDGGTYPALMTAIVMSDLVRTIRTEKKE